MRTVECLPATCVAVCRAAAKLGDAPTSASPGSRASACRNPPIPVPIPVALFPDCKAVDQVTVSPHRPALRRCPFLMNGANANGSYAWRLVLFPQNSGFIGRSVRKITPA
jgi:hypothetical protein